MTGYKCEDWTVRQLDKCLAYPLRADFLFRLKERTPKPCDTVVATTLPIYLSDASLPGPDHKDRLTSLAGSFKRLGTQVPAVRYSEMRRVIRYARKYIYPQFRTIQACEIPDTKTWIEHVNHPEKRKQELREAYDFVLSHGIIKPTDSDIDDCSRCKSFIKDEKYEEEKPSRWINASSDIVKVAFGPVADAIMHVQCEHPATIKTVPVSERALYIWNKLGGEDVIAVSSDASSMEDHYANIPISSRNSPLPLENSQVSDPRYRLYNDFAAYVLGDVLVSKDQIDAIRFLFFKSTKQTKQPFSIRYKLWQDIRDAVTLASFCKSILDTYRRLDMRDFGYVVVNGILCSGEMNTSSKNLISMQIMVNYAQYDLSGGRHTTVNSVGEGDDALAVYHGGIGPDEQWWISKGWLVKVEYVGKVSGASFCGLIFAPEEMVSVPDIRKTLAKFGFSNRRYAHSARPCLMGLLRSKALSMACEYGDVPILGHLAQRMLHLTRHVHVRQSIIDTMDQFSRTRFQGIQNLKPWLKKPNIGPATRRLVFEMQNIPVGLQLQIEEFVSTIEFGGFSLPRLDFDAVWINNMSRCFDHPRVYRIFNLKGRSRVCGALERKIIDDILNSPVATDIPRAWKRKIDRMLKQLRYLAKGSI